MADGSVLGDSEMAFKGCVVLYIIICYTLQSLPCGLMNPSTPIPYTLKKEQVDL
jgi:hypothetical protein